MGMRGGRPGRGGRRNWTPRNVHIVGRRGRGRRWGGYWWGGGYPHYAYPSGCYAIPTPPYYYCPTPYPYTPWGYPYYQAYNAGPWGGANPFAYY